MIENLVDLRMWRTERDKPTGEIEIVSRSERRPRIYAFWQWNWTGSISKTLSGAWKCFRKQRHRRYIVPTVLTVPRYQCAITLPAKAVDSATCSICNLLF